MTIELDDKSYIVGMWFSSNPENNNDWLACIIRDPENPKKYKGWSRFRYSKDSKIWNSEDKKSWTTFGSKEGLTDEDVIALGDLMQSEIELGFPKKDCIIVKGSLAELIPLAQAKPWMNMKQEKINNEHNA